jgi:hypothetical protein
VKLVAQNAHDLGGDRVIQEIDGVLHVATVVLGHGALVEILPRRWRISLMSVRKAGDVFMESP